MYKHFNKWLTSFFILGLSVFIYQSCKHEPEIFISSVPIDTGVPCSPDSVYFEKDILPLLTSNCAKSGCHDAITKEEGIDYSNYVSTLKTGKIKPGNPNGSDMYEAITETDPDKMMPPPPAAQLSAEQKGLIRKWIAQGAQNIKCNSGCDTLNVKYNSHIASIVNNNCKGCHSGVAPSGNIGLTDYASVKVQALNGKLLGTIRHESGFKPMPPSGIPQLSTCNINAIKIWIENGAPEQ